MGAVDRASQPFALWLISVLGPYLLLLPLAALVCFVLVLILTIRGKGPFAAAAVILLTMFPMLLGLFASVASAIGFMHFMGTSLTPPTLNELCDAMSVYLALPFVAMLLSVSVYAVATIGSLIRAFRTDESGRNSH